ncbi:hypothetical protein OG405_11315 [Nocardia sp. NBC_01329]|nr:hypothetical protein OG405_11315 [Nocardia sp. NBC_01329]
MRTILLGSAYLVRAAAEKRLWAQFTARVGPGTALALVRLLESPDDAKHQISELERLRKGVFRPSWKGTVKALRRLEGIQAVGICPVDMGTVPPGQSPIGYQLAAEQRSACGPRRPDSSSAPDPPETTPGTGHSRPCRSLRHEITHSTTPLTEPATYHRIAPTPGYRPLRVRDTLF